MFGEFHLEVLIGLGLPAIGAAFFVIKHFWIETKCFHLMKQRLEQLEEENKQGKKTHVEIFQRLNEIDRHYSSLEGKVDIIVDKLK